MLWKPCRDCPRQGAGGNTDRESFWICSGSFGDFKWAAGGDASVAGLLLVLAALCELELRYTATI